MSLDLEANRRSRKYSRGQQVGRVLWALCRPLFRLSPRVLFGWRAWLLRVLGARIGRHVHIYNTVEVFLPSNLAVGDWSAIGDRALLYNLGPINIGTKVTISQRAHLCAGTHDYTRADMPLLKPPITVQDQAWICADAFVGPGVTVGEGAVVGARAVVVKDVPPWVVVAGNPARTLKSRTLEAE
jgi:putative colanic acid biosynthesis acetyltransferase WcaF